MPERLSPEARDTQSFDRWLSAEFKQEYIEQYQTLNRLGLLDILPESGETGLIGIDNKEYPIPSPEAIEQEIRNNKEVYEKKFAQGFTQLQLTPFAIPLDILINTLEQRLKEHHKQNKLLAAKENPNDPDQPLDLDLNQPVYVWNEWKGSDKDGSCQYYPSSFNQTNHQGYAKTEILKAQANSSFPGWNVLLIEPNLNIPRQGKGKTQGNRKQLEAGLTPEQYLEKLQNDPQYQNEQGLTNEDWLTLFITHLEKTNQVLDDYQGKGSLCYLTGSFKPLSRGLGYGCWFRDGRRASLSGCGPGNRDGSYGLRPAVGLGKKLRFVRQQAD